MWRGIKQLWQEFSPPARTTMVIWCVVGALLYVLHYWILYVLLLCACILVMYFAGKSVGRKGE